MENRKKEIQKIEQEIVSIKKQQKELKLKCKILRNLINELKNEVL